MISFTRMQYIKLERRRERVTIIYVLFVLTHKPEMKIDNIASNQNKIQYFKVHVHETFLELNSFSQLQ